MSANLPTIVFPEASEFVSTKVPQRRALSLKHLLAVVYIFGGISGFLAVLAKFVIQPLFEQLSLDRGSYAALATKLMRELNAKLAGMVSKIPRVQTVGGNQNYVDSQTQTDDNTKPSTKQPGSPMPSVEDRKLGQELTNLSKNTVLDEVPSVKYALEQLQSLSSALSFPQYGHKPMGFELVMDKKEKDKKEVDVQGDVMKEIRSIKGSLLSARRFPS